MASWSPAGQLGPLVQTAVDAVKPVGMTSVSLEPEAALGPWFVTVIVNVSGLFGFSDEALGVLVIVYENNCTGSLSLAKQVCVGASKMRAFGSGNVEQLEFV